MTPDEAKSVISRFMFDKTYGPAFGVPCQVRIMRAIKLDIPIPQEAELRRALECYPQYNVDITEKGIAFPKI